MVADPARYTWLTDSGIGEAGCITVVAEPDLRKLESAFGFDPAEDGSTEPDELDASVWLSAQTDVAVVTEDNGFQGSRPEVVRPASRASALGKAASLYWNVNGQVHFSCARRGRVLCSFELLEPHEDELEGVPRGLRPLVAQCADPDADLLALGAAMVETFTGAGFGPGLIDEGRPRTLTPQPDDLQVYDATYDGYWVDRALVDAIAALDPDAQRRVAAWAAAAAVAEAGLADDPVLRAAVTRFGQGADAGTAAALEAMSSRLTRESARRGQRLMETDSDGGLTEMYANQAPWAVEAARYARHPDPLSAAIACVEAAVVTAALARTDRGTVFVVNERGRWRSGQTPNPRHVEWMASLRRLLVADQGGWAEIIETFPRPLTGEQRAEALRRDHEREADGEFATWQYGARNPLEPAGPIVFALDEPHGEEPQ